MRASFLRGVIVVLCMLSFASPQPARASLTTDVEDAIDATGALPFQFSTWRPILDTCENDDVATCAEAVSASPQAQDAGVPSYLPQMIESYIDIRTENWGELAIDGGKAVACAAIQVLAGGLDLCSYMPLLAAVGNVGGEAVLAIADELGLDKPVAQGGNGGAPTSAYAYACGPGWSTQCTECADGSAPVTDNAHPGAIGCRYCPPGLAKSGGQCVPCTLAGVPPAPTGSLPGSGFAGPDTLGSTCIVHPAVCPNGTAPALSAGSLSCQKICTGGIRVNGNCQSCLYAKVNGNTECVAVCPPNSYAGDDANCMPVAACGAHAIPDPAHPLTCLSCGEGHPFYGLSPVGHPRFDKNGQPYTIYTPAWPICAPNEPKLSVPPSHNFRAAMERDAGRSVQREMPVAEEPRSVKATGRVMPSRDGDVATTSMPWAWVRRALRTQATRARLGRGAHDDGAENVTAWAMPRPFPLQA